MTWGICCQMLVWSSTHPILTREPAQRSALLRGPERLHPEHNEREMIETAIATAIIFSWIRFDVLWQYPCQPQVHGAARRLGAGEQPTGTTRTQYRNCVNQWKADWWLVDGHETNLQRTLGRGVHVTGTEQYDDKDLSWRRRGSRRKQTFNVGENADGRRLARSRRRPRTTRIAAA